MRKLQTLAAALAVAVLATACASMQTTAGRTLSSVALTADATMQGWAMWVAEGQATAQQQEQVKAAYVKYQASMKVAKAAYNTLALNGDQTAWLQASAVLETNQQALLALTRIFMTTGGAK